MGQQSWVDAVKDLQLAQDMCAAGDPQRDLISSKLAEARVHAPEVPKTAPKPAPASYNDGSVVIEEVTESEEEIQPARAHATSASRAPAGVPSGTSEYAARVLQNDPEHARRMMTEMSNQPPEELERMAKAAGMPGFDAATAKQVRSQYPTCMSLAKAVPQALPRTRTGAQ